jgi:hypothetical protein
MGGIHRESLSIHGEFPLRSRCPLLNLTSVHECRSMVVVKAADDPAMKEGNMS